MILILPVRYIVMFAILGLSSYSLYNFILTASYHEIQLLIMFLNMTSIGIGFMIFSQLKDQQNHTSYVSYDEEELIQRIIGELTLRRTITFAEHEQEMDELRELVAQPQPHPLEELPTEETTEFADLLEAEKKTQ